METRSDQR